MLIESLWKQPVQEARWNEEMRLTYLKRLNITKNRQVKRKTLRQTRKMPTKVTAHGKVNRIKGKKTISCTTHRHHFVKFANFEEVLAELVSVLSLTSAPLCISYYKQSKLYRVVNDDSKQLEWARYPNLGLF